MKTFITLLLITLSGSAITFSVQAEDMQAAEQDIKAECREESKNAETPEIYYEECVADRLQALQEQQDGNGDTAPAERG